MNTITVEVFLRLLKQNIIWFILLPCITAGMAYYATRNEKKDYKSQATVYTGLVSRYSLLSDQKGNVADRSTDAFDNLLTTLHSKETLVEVSLSLLTDHLMLRQPDSLVLGEAGFTKLRAAIPIDWQAMLMTDRDPIHLRMTLDSLAKSPVANPIKTLLLASDSYYSYNLINEKLKSTARKSTNDVLLLEYESDDPAVAQRTIHYAIDVLNKRYSNFKASETNSVVGYYEAKLQKAKEKLDQADGALRAFNVKHKVLDFDEESRGVAASREALTNEYNQELMRRNAAKASLDALDRRRGQQGNIYKANSELAEKQKKLTQAESQLANARAYNQPASAIARLQTAVNKASEELKTSAQKYDGIANTDDAVPSQAVATDRLAKSLEYEESVAKLELYEKRLNEYQAKTSEFTPLGSQLRQLNRDLSLAEKEYLDLLQQVEQSQTRQQDIAVGGSMEVLDGPNLPLLPQGSKRMQLVGIGFGVGLFLAVLLMVISFWLDKRIHSPEQAETMVGMPITALFPTVKKPHLYTKVTRASRSMFEQLFNAINIEIAQVVNRPYPPVITLFSIRTKQGKTWVADGLTALYAQADQQVAVCYPRTTGKEMKEYKGNVTYFPYTIRPDFMNVTSLTYLLDHTDDFEVSQFDRVILELPALINHQIPVYLLKESALSMLVIDANSAWARAEKQLLSLYIRVTAQPILTVLNRVGGDYVDAPGKTDSRQATERPAYSMQASRNER
jgi:uncharacterized protein involved in exopolysaccharide biosynthesis